MPSGVHSAAGFTSRLRAAFCCDDRLPWCRRHGCWLGWGLGAWLFDSFAPLGTGRVPGLAPAGEVLVLCVAKEKYPKERRPCYPCPCASLRAACGAHARDVPQNSLRAARCVQTTAASQIVKVGGVLRHPQPPRALRSSARTQGLWKPKNKNQTSTRAIGALGPVLAPSPAGGRLEWGAHRGPSAAMARGVPKALVDAPTQVAPSRSEGVADRG